MAETTEHVSNVLKRIERAAIRSGRTAEDITLVAVSKTKPITAIIEAYHAGIRHFGENRANELEQKAEQLSHLSDLQWHFIGRLQTRQSLPVANYAAAFHAVDRMKIATRLSSQVSQLNRTLAAFIQVNVSGEDSKAGFDCTNWDAIQNGKEGELLIQAIEKISQLPGLDVRGLMTMAPYGAPEAITRPLFRRMRELSEWVQSNPSTSTLSELSIGMSADFEIAIEEGATSVRVGSAIFGARQYG